jgi:hypothetical protein
MSRVMNGKAQIRTGENAMLTASIAHGSHDIARICRFGWY